MTCQHVVRALNLLAPIQTRREASSKNFERLMPAEKTAVTHELAVVEKLAHQPDVDYEDRAMLLVVARELCVRSVDKARVLPALANVLQRLGLINSASTAETFVGRFSASS